MTEPAGYKELAAFAREAATYFERRDTGGEDMAFWANVTNAENCRKLASAIEAQRAELDEVEAAVYGRHERGFVCRPLIDPPSPAAAVRARIEALEAERDEARRLAERQRKHIEDMGRRIHNQRVQLHDTWQTVESRAGWLKGWPIQSRALAMAIAAGKERRASEARCKRLEEHYEEVARLALQENTNGG